MVYATANFSTCTAVIHMSISSSRIAFAQPFGYTYPATTRHGSENRGYRHRHEFLSPVSR